MKSSWRARCDARVQSRPLPAPRRVGLAGPSRTLGNELKFHSASGLVSYAAIADRAMTTDTPNSQRFVESQRWPSPMRPQAIVRAAQRVEEPTDLGWQDVQSALVLIADAHASATPSCREIWPRVRQSKDERPHKVLRIQRAVGRRRPLVLRIDSPQDPDGECRLESGGARIGGA